MDVDQDLVSLKIALAGPDAGKNIHLLMRYAASVLDEHAGTLALQTNGVAVWKLDFFLPDSGLTLHTHVCAAEASGDIHLPEMWTKLLSDADGVVLIRDDGSARKKVEAFYGELPAPLVLGLDDEAELSSRMMQLISDLTPRA